MSMKTKHVSIDDKWLLCFNYNEKCLMSTVALVNRLYWLYISFSFLDVWNNRIPTIVHIVHKWRILSVKMKYVFLIHSFFFTLKGHFFYTLLHLNWASFKNPCFWSCRYICTCCRRTGCTPSGGDRGRCDVAFCLGRAPEGGGEEDNLTV